jgi:hypothetical protein
MHGLADFGIGGLGLAHALGFAFEAGLELRELLLGLRFGQPACGDVGLDLVERVSRVGDVLELVVAVAAEALAQAVAELLDAGFAFGLLLVVGGEGVDSLFELSKVGSS